MCTPRHPRGHGPGLPYHLLARGNSGQAALRPGVPRQRLLLLHREPPQDRQDTLAAQRDQHQGGPVPPLLYPSPAERGPPLTVSLVAAESPARGAFHRSGADSARGTPGRCVARVSRCPIAHPSLRWVVWKRFERPWYLACRHRPCARREVRLREPGGRVPPIS